MPNMTDRELIQGLLREFGLSVAGAASIARNIREDFEMVSPPGLSKERWDAIMKCEVSPDAEQKAAIDNILTSLFDLFVRSLVNLSLPVQVEHESWREMALAFICYSVEGRL